MGLFGGNSDSSQAQSQATASINSSGWVVGGGSAQGGKLTADSGSKMPWYAWASLGIIALAYWRKKKKGG